MGHVPAFGTEIVFSYLASALRHVLYSLIVRQCSRRLSRRPSCISLRTSPFIATARSPGSPPPFSYRTSCPGYALCQQPATPVPLYGIVHNYARPSLLCSMCSSSLQLSLFTLSALRRCNPQHNSPPQSGTVTVDSSRDNDPGVPNLNSTKMCEKMAVSRP
jgi:hypothetical protein